MRLAQASQRSPSASGDHPVDTIKELVSCATVFSLHSFFHS